ncbi:Diguanylate cyclase domain protein [Beijerinckiaceae bacterium RH AL1]|nr:EAL domain-containing protein [Beijerinckiaceae bacterium]VVB46136.1 Diguanylate cyclase domain protein [Beijerinckiaceae bacterium RH CH11]VVB46220.1 Diguanylate cyclase domain protein [Beijerinckiaceae bacterium RH AL8]VVC55221.1 Diguanylate cyclase domain protein [Beijerinckiaceae bacterium RH AL1]
MIDTDPAYGHSATADAEIRKSLTAELFGPLGAALPAYAAAVSIATAGVFFEGAPRDFVCLAAILFVTAIRIGLRHIYRRRADLRRTPAQMKGWELAYGCLAGLWTLLLGIDSSFMMLSDSVILQLFGTIMVIGMTGGIAARHAPHPWIVIIQMVAILVPFTTALLIHYGLEATGLIIMTIFMFLGVWSATRQINANLTMAMRNGLANRILKDRFDTALNNMTHGLVMFDAHRTLEFANDRFAAMFNLDGNALKIGMSLDEIVDLCQSGFTGRIRTREQNIAIFERALKSRMRHEESLKFSDGRILSFRCEPIANGGTVLMVEDLTEKHEAAAQIAHLAHYDVLTGLPNRTSFREWFPRVVREAKIQNTAFSLFYLDLDGFKEVNDTLGHAIGDKLLVEVASRLTNGLRRTDLCYRLGGDEFVFVQYAPEGDDEALASRLIDLISYPFEIEGNRVKIGLSIGIARFGEDGDAGDELLKNADIALYKAKEAGKQTFRRFRHEMAAEAMDRRMRELDLRRAIEDDAIDVHFQPIVQVGTRRIVGCEALLRWFHPTRGLMRPDETIKLAEATGLIVDLGAIVMRKACMEAATWAPGISVAVNLSAAQFRDGAVVAQIKSALASSGLPGHRLEVEITESLAFGNLAGVRAAIDEIRALGVKIAIDDFGTGYSSLSYLSQIPFDTVKIDRSFVLRIGNDPMASALIQLMAGLMQSLGKSMVVEGVETSEQVAILRQLGAEYMQGFYFSKAKPATELAATFKKMFRLREVA